MCCLGHAYSELLSRHLESGIPRRSGAGDRDVESSDEDF